ncbi:hypothetical protein N9C66_00790 [Akkermansiaceae bacterium]|nr:hypothetical protein [Akkermansiaceae bacterium]MDA9829849.1 hypothetical protein [Akkermansiaceae bacterium]MDB4393431.1 hypothetical protein [bacterium]MDB4493417.1 hypothetical protein [bacterium]MDB4502004.1 hypothetical protein [Akkermansiaceae bacterium]
MIHKLNFVSFATALGFFFLPWLDFQCSEKSMITQSGFQTVTGGGSLGEDTKSMAESKKNEENQDGFGVALFVAVALGCVALGLLLAFIGLLGGGPPSPALPALAAVALILIGLQMKLGFPMEQKIAESFQKPGAEEENALADMGKLFAQMNIRIVYRPWIYAELGSLFLPVGIAFFAMKPRGSHG